MVYRPGGAKESVAPPGRYEWETIASTGCTRGYIPALLRSENKGTIA